jgi:hypothetical protein
MKVVGLEATFHQERTPRYRRAMKPIAHAGYQEYFVTTSDNCFFVDFMRQGQKMVRVHDESNE